MMATVVSATVGLQLRLEFLEIPYVMVALGFLPGVAVLGLSVKFASAFLKFHKYFLKSNRWPWNKNKQFHYNQITEYADEPKLKRLALFTMLRVFAITYNIFALTEFLNPAIGQPEIRFVLIIGDSFLALMIAPFIDVSIKLLRVSGIIFEEKKEGYRLHMGKELESRLDQIIGVSGIISFAYLFIKSTDLHGIGLTLAIITCSLPSLAVSYYFIEKKHLKKMQRQLLRNIGNDLDSEMKPFFQCPIRTS